MLAGSIYKADLLLFLTLKDFTIIEKNTSVKTVSKLELCVTELVALSQSALSSDFQGESWVLIWAWWYMCRITVLGRLRQEACWFKGYALRLVQGNAKHRNK